MSYSSFFSSGLLAPRHTPPASRPDSPTALVREISDIGEDTAPTDIFHFDKPNAHSSAVERPRLRKRRSSITVATSPMAQIKSPLRSAGAAAQRQNALVNSMGGRSRSGSVNEYGQARLGSGFATDGNSLMGRLRSGGVGLAMRSRRVLRKPIAPPPSAPLPPLPVFTISAPPDEPHGIRSPPSTPRRCPLTRRSSTTDNYDQAMASSPIPVPRSPNESTNTYAKSAPCETDEDMMKEN